MLRSAKHIKTTFSVLRSAKYIFYFHEFWLLFQVLYEKGGRKFGFLSLSPLGCLPALRVLNPKASELEGGGCFEGACELALAHNNALKAVLTSLEYLLDGFKYCNSNFYNWLQDRISNPSKYGMFMKFCNLYLFLQIYNHQNQKEKKIYKYI